MPLVRDLVKKRSGLEIPLLPPDTLAADALKLMHRHDLSALPVALDGVVCGVFSERDYARATLLNRYVEGSTRVKDLMSEQVISVSPANSIEECLTIMQSAGVRHLAVVDGGNLVDFIAWHDVIDYALDSRDFLIEQLLLYINDGRFRVRRLPLESDDKSGHYDLDGASFENGEIYIAGDAHKSAGKIKKAS